MKATGATLAKASYGNRSTICLCIILFGVMLLVPAARMQSSKPMPDYRNPSLPVDQRVADLLARMTLEEKIAQLVCLWSGKPQVGPPNDFSTDRGYFSPEKAQLVMKN